MSQPFKIRTNVKWVTDNVGNVLGFQNERDQFVPIPNFSGAGTGNASGIGLTSPIIVAMAPAQYVRTQDGVTDTAYADLAAITIPKEYLALMGLRGFLDIEAAWTFSNVTQTKDLNILVGGASLGTPSGASGNQSAVMKVRLYAEGALNDQVFFNGGLQVFAASSNAIVERTLDLTVDTLIQFQAKWSADPGAAATIRLLTYVVTIFSSPV